MNMGSVYTQAFGDISNQIMSTTYIKGMGLEQRADNCKRMVRNDMGSEGDCVMESRSEQFKNDIFEISAGAGDARSGVLQIATTELSTPTFSQLLISMPEEQTQVCMVVSTELSRSS